MFMKIKGNIFEIGLFLSFWLVSTEGFCIVETDFEDERHVIIGGVLLEDLDTVSLRTELVRIQAEIAAGVDVYGQNIDVVAHEILYRELEERLCTFEDVGIIH